MNVLTQKSKRNQFVFVFDLDNTLVKTNQANNNAYKEAVRTITGKDISMNMGRFTRSELRAYLPDLPMVDYDAIITLKEELYVKQLHKTKLNKQLCKILTLTRAGGNETILLTECSKTRAKQVCDYHSLTPFFSVMFFKEDYEDDNKYGFLKKILHPLSSVVLFENEDSEIKRAIRHGLHQSQIITIKF
ncbi:MAG: hypothetical protein IKO75_00240 [Bacteroidales bacterium]|nr:hypothetical protein [Bacteroidales bacterium]